MISANETYTIQAFPSKEMPTSYEALIYSKWLRSLRFGNPVFKNIDSDEYYKNYHAYIGNLMKKPDCVIRLAILTDEPDVVLGFSVAREDVLDYIHVHKDQRRLGIAKKLLPPKVTTMSHITLTGMQIWRSNPKYRHFKFNPFA